MWVHKQEYASWFSTSFVSLIFIFTHFCLFFILHNFFHKYAKNQKVFVPVTYDVFIKAINKHKGTNVVFLNKNYMQF